MQLLMRCDLPVTVDSGRSIFKFHGTMGKVVMVLSAARIEFCFFFPMLAALSFYIFLVASRALFQKRAELKAPEATVGFPTKMIT